MFKSSIRLTTELHVVASERTFERSVSRTDSVRDAQLEGLFAQRSVGMLCSKASYHASLESGRTFELRVVARFAELHRVARFRAKRISDRVRSLALSRRSAERRGLSSKQDFSNSYQHHLK